MSSKWTYHLQSVDFWAVLVGSVVALQRVSGRWIHKRLHSPDLTCSTYFTTYTRVSKTQLLLLSIAWSLLTPF